MAEPRPEPARSIENGIDLLFLAVPTRVAGSTDDFLMVHLECRHARTQLTVRGTLDDAPRIVGSLIVQHREAIVRTERQVCTCEPKAKASVH